MIHLKPTGAIAPYGGDYAIDLNGVLYDRLYLKYRDTGHDRVIITNFTQPYPIRKQGKLWGWSFSPQDFLYMGKRSLPGSIAIVDYVQRLLTDPEANIGYPLGLNHKVKV